MAENSAKLMIKTRSGLQAQAFLDGYRYDLPFIFSTEEVSKLADDGLARIRVVQDSDADMEFWFATRDIKKLMAAILAEAGDTKKNVPTYLAFRQMGDELKGYLMLSVRQSNHLASLGELKTRSLQGNRLAHPTIPPPDAFDEYLEAHANAHPSTEEMMELTPHYIKMMHQLPVANEVRQMWLRTGYLRFEAAKAGLPEPTMEELVAAWAKWVG